MKYLLSWPVNDFESVILIKACEAEEPLFLRSMTDWSASGDEPVWKVVSAVLARPGYSDQTKLQKLHVKDGADGIRNPAEYICQYRFQHLDDRDNSCVVSIGCADANCLDSSQIKRNTAHTRQTDRGPQEERAAREAVCSHKRAYDSMVAANRPYWRFSRPVGIDDEYEHQLSPFAGFGLEKNELPKLKDEISNWLDKNATRQMMKRAAGRLVCSRAYRERSR